jgi:hypothetical protein
LFASRAYRVLLLGSALMMAVAAILTSKLSVGQREAVASIDGAALLLQALGLANDGSLKPFG